MKNPEYYDRRIKQYQKKHRISDAGPNATTSSKLRLKRDIESDHDHDHEVEPPKRRKIAGERSVEPVSVSWIIR